MNDKTNEELKKQVEQMGEEIWKLTQHLGQCETKLNEAVRLLEAYGGGVSEIDEWLKNQ